MEKIKDNQGSPSGINRKQFLRTAGSTALFAFLGIHLTGCDVTSSSSSDDREPENGNDEDSAVSVDGNIVTLNLDADSLSALRSAGGWMLLSQASVIAVNIDGTLIRAFTDVCPHASCRDGWGYSNERLVCSCHNSVFENDGTFVSGPAGRDLPEFSVERKGNVVTITK
ncbi:Rieske (2Fe-2S) protein [Balneolaceae bacterium ANBcel3]|nr:Rieske (2Fe-2S) protein [Balneolaceae bacterium ANBcel3]